MSNTPNFMSFGQREESQLKSTNHGMQKQAQTKPQINYQL
jgi:hypothetical protein